MQIQDFEAIDKSLQCVAPSINIRRKTRNWGINLIQNLVCIEPHLYYPLSPLCYFDKQSRKTKKENVFSVDKFWLSILDAHTCESKCVFHLPETLQYVFHSEFYQWFPHFLEPLWQTKLGHLSLHATCLKP